MSPGNDRRNILRYSRKSAGILSLLLLFNSIGMNACGQATAETGHVSISMTGMENTPVINYTVPTLTPNVLVDQQGYAAVGEKQAVVKGRQPVDVDLCTVFMESIRNRGEELAKRSHNMIDAVMNVNNGTEDLLKRAEELSCANYVLYSYQYTEILEDFLHYLMGRNRDSVSYYPEEGDAADYLLLIAQQVSLADRH